MPNGSAEAHSAVYFMSLEQGRARLRLTSEVWKNVPWLSEESQTISCQALLGAFGGIQIVPLVTAPSGLRKRVSARLQALGPIVDHATEPAVQLARFFATAWRLDCSYEPTHRRFAIILPEQARNFKIVPHEGIVAVFVAGDILEIWGKDEWLAHVRIVSSQQLQLGAQLPTELTEV